MRRLGGPWLLLALALAACAPERQPAEPALWRVEGPSGQTAWLFGTIHALPQPVEWRSGAVRQAFDEADRIVVEVADLGDDAAMAEIFARLSRSQQAEPLLANRVRPELRSALATLLEKGGMKEGQFRAVETWAAALMLARVGDTARNSKYGVDRAVIEAAQGRPVIALEGAESQLRIFDALPEREQRDLLEAVVTDGGDPAAESTTLAETWRKGDMRAIETETRKGILADPELRAALFTDRNASWTEKLAAMLARGDRPFVAVGAAHMAGPEGLPAMLENRGYRVTRVQ